MTRPSCILTMIWAGTALLGAGCQSALYPVRGTVSFDDGTPATTLQGGFITFQSLDGQVSSQGPIRSDGSFSLSTEAEDDGALPGKYKVLVTPPPWHGDERQQAVAIIDQAYADPRTSELEAVVEERDNEVPLRLRRAGHK